MRKKKEIDSRLEFTETHFGPSESEDLLKLRQQKKQVEQEHMKGILKE